MMEKLTTIGGGSVGRGADFADDVPGDTATAITSTAANIGAATQRKIRSGNNSSFCRHVGAHLPTLFECVVQLRKKS